MFVDAVLPNLLLFGVGQAAAWLYLRTGRFWLGATTTVALWVLLDWWLVGRFVLGLPLHEQQLPLVLLQLLAVAAAAAFAGARLRRRLAAAVRPQRFRAGLEQLLAGRLDAARATFRGLVRSDPWDAPAWIALGDALRHGGDLRRARRCYRRAARVDTAGGYRDLLRHRGDLGRAAVRAPSAGSGARPGAGAAPPTHRAAPEGARPTHSVGS